MKPSELTMDQVVEALRLGCEFESICRELVLLLETADPKDQLTILTQATLLARRAKNIYTAEADQRAEDAKLRRLSLGVAK